MNRFENQTLALAGMFQSAALIEQQALTGQINPAAFDCSFNSLFAFDVATTLEVFGDLAGLNRGLNALTGYLGGEQESSGQNIAYYVLSMLKIASGLRTDARISAALQESLQRIESRTREFDMSQSSVIDKVDGLYQDTISKMTPRIIVRGEQSYLTNNEMAGKVRTLLLAGIRAAVLWQQLGGSKWKLLFSRKRYVATAKLFLRSSQIP